MEAMLTLLQIGEPVDNPKVLVALEQVARAAGVAELGCSKEVGMLLYKLVTSPKGKALAEGHQQMLARRIGSGDVSRNMQFEAALTYLASTSAPAESELCAAAGVGVTISEGEVASAVSALVDSERADILEARYLTNAGLMLRKVLTGANAERLKWADPAMLKAALDGAIASLLGPKKVPISSAWNGIPM
ncbi:Glutaminyl-tRNA synthetase [Pavlovales sp. CCMP2436]|nr:Glutaminyl-tRNA synthetase [Pavlovales sp. CCMP2436]